MPHNASHVSSQLDALRDYYRPVDTSRSPAGQLLQQVGTRVAAPFRAFWQESPFTAPGSGLLRRPYQPGSIPAPVSLDRAVEQGRLAQGLTATPTTPSSPSGSVDWASIIAAMEGQRPSGGGVSVNRGLFNLSETGEEARMLEREMADIEARRVAGDEALRTGWGNVRSANSAAAEKARSMASSAGMAAASIWSDAAQQARNIAAQQAQAVGAFEGRAGIDVSPDAGVADWAGFMESQAPADRALAERRQEILGSDLDWMAGMAGSQAEAYAGDLQRQAGIMAFERAREHNLRVQDRIAEERMTLAQMEMQAQAANASLAAQREQFDPFEQVNNMVGAAAVMGSPDLLAQQLGVTREQAQSMITNFLRGTTQTVLAATPPK